MKTRQRTEQRRAGDKYVKKSMSVRGPWVAQGGNWKNRYHENEGEEEEEEETDST